MPRRKEARAVRGRQGDPDEDGGREDLDWTPKRLKATLEGLWRAAASLLEGAPKERP